MLKYYFLTIIILLRISLYSQSPNINGYNVYYGSIHNHSNFSSDAKGTPLEAFAYARDTSHLDFFGLSEHCIYLTQEKWDTLKIISQAANRDSSFTSFCGFEWTSSAKYGHISIFNTDSFTSILDPLTDNFTEICQWIMKHNGLAFFNHPGRENGTNEEFMHFETKPIPNIVGMELWNRNIGFSHFYQNDGYSASDGNKGFYDEALIRGWRIGTEGSEDNHWANWGLYSDFRTALLAKANTKKDLLDAYWNRRFYSTLDKNLALSFMLQNSEMGDSVVEGTVLLKIEAFDVDSEVFTSVILKRNGDTIKVWTPNSKNVSITDSLKCVGGEYYYVIVTQEDGNQAISSPIFIKNERVSLHDTTKTNVISNHRFAISPNPFQDRISIHNYSNETISVSLYSITGVCVYNAELLSNSLIPISTALFPTGCYFVKIVSDRGCELFEAYKK